MELVPEGTAEGNPTLASVDGSISSSEKPQFRSVGKPGATVGLLAGLGALQFLPTVVALAVIVSGLLLGIVWIVTPPDGDKLAWWRSLRQGRVDERTVGG